MNAFEVYKISITPGQCSKIHKQCSACKEVMLKSKNFYKKSGSKGRGSGTGKNPVGTRFMSKCKKCTNASKVMKRRYKPILMKMYGNVCQYCKKEVEPNKITIDHKIPSSKGGSDELKNLTFACMECNVEKGDRTHLHYLTLKGFNVI